MEDEIYELEGAQVSGADIMEWAEVSEMDIDEYLNLSGYTKIETDPPKSTDPPKKEAEAGKEDDAQTTDAAAASESGASTVEDGSSGSQKTKTIIGSTGRPTQIDIYDTGLMPEPTEIDLKSDQTNLPNLDSVKIKNEILEKDEKLTTIINNVDPTKIELLQKKLKTKQQEEAKIEKEAIEKYQNDKIKFETYSVEVDGIDNMLGENGVNKYIELYDTYQTRDVGTFGITNPSYLLGIDDKEVDEIQTQINTAQENIEKYEQVVNKGTADQGALSQFASDAGIQTQLDEDKSRLGGQRGLLKRLEKEKEDKLRNLYNKALFSGNNQSFISTYIADKGLDLRIEDLNRIRLTPEGSQSPGKTQYNNTRAVMTQSVEKDKTSWGGTETGEKANVGLIEKIDENLSLLDGPDRVKYTRQEILNKHRELLATAGLEFKTDAMMGGEFELFINPETKEVIKFKKDSGELTDFLTSDDYAQNSNEKGFINAADSDVLQLAKLIPTDNNEIMEEMTNKQYEIVYLANLLKDNLEAYRDDQSYGAALSNFFELFFTGTMGGEREGGVFDDPHLRDLLGAAKDGRLTKLPHALASSPSLKPLVDLINQKSNEFDVLSQAYLLNYNPINFEDDDFYNGAVKGTAEQFGNPYLDSTDRRGVFYNWVSENYPEAKFTDEEVEAIYDRTFLNEVGYGTPGFLAIMGEFALTRGVLGATGILKKAQGAGGLFNEILFGTGKIGRKTEKYVTAFIEELVVLKARNVGTGSLYDAEEMSLLFAVANPAGLALDRGFLKLIESGKIDRIMNYMAYVPTSAQYLVKTGVAHPVTGATVMTIGEIPVGLYDVITGAPDPSNPDIPYTFSSFVGHTFDPEQFAQKAALCFVTKNAVPIKVATETYKKVVRDVKAITSGSRYKQHINRSTKTLNTSSEKLTGDYENKIKAAAAEKYNELGIGKPFTENLTVLEITNADIANSKNVSDLFNIAARRAQELSAKNPKQAKIYREALENLNNFGKSNRTIKDLNDLLKIKEAEESLLLDFEYENFLRQNKNDKSGDVQQKDINILIGKAKTGAGLSPETVKTLGALRSKNLVKKILEDAGVDPATIKNYSNYTDVSNYLLGKGRENAIDFNTPQGKEYIKVSTKIIQTEQEINRLKEEQNPLLKTQANKEIVRLKERVEEYELKQEDLIVKAKEIAKDKAIVDMKRTIEERNKQEVGRGEMVKGQDAMRVALEQAKDNKEITQEQYDAIIDNMDRGVIYDNLNIDVKRKLPNGEVVKELILISDIEAVAEQFETGKGPHEDEHVHTNYMLENLGIRGNEKLEKEFVKSFLDTLTDAQKDIILEKVSKHPDYKNNPYTKEWFNYYAEALVKGEIGMKDVENISLNQQVKLFEELIEDTFPGVDIELTAQRYKEIINNHAKSFKEGGTYGDLSRTSFKPSPKPSTSKIVTASTAGKHVGDYVDASAKIDILKQIKADKERVSQLQAEARSYSGVEREGFDYEIEMIKTRIANNERNLAISDRNERNIELFKTSTDSRVRDKAWDELKEDNVVVGQLKTKGRNFILNHPTLEGKTDLKNELINDFNSNVDYELLTFVNNHKKDGAPFGQYVRDLERRWMQIVEGLPHDFKFYKDVETSPEAAKKEDDSKPTEIVRIKTPGIDKVVDESGASNEIDLATDSYIRSTKDFDYTEFKKIIGDKGADKIKDKLGTGEKYEESLHELYDDFTKLIENENDFFRLRNWDIFYETAATTGEGKNPKRVQVSKGKEDVVYNAKIPTQKEFEEFFTYQGEWSVDPYKKDGSRKTDAEIKRETSNKTSQRRLWLSKFLALHEAKEHLKEIIDTGGISEIQVTSTETVTSEVIVGDPFSRGESNPEKLQALENKQALQDAGQILRAFQNDYEVEVDASARDVYEKITDKVARDIFKDLEMEPREIKEWVEEYKKATQAIPGVHFDGKDVLLTFGTYENRKAFNEIAENEGFVADGNKYSDSLNDLSNPESLNKLLRLYDKFKETMNITPKFDFDGKNVTLDFKNNDQRFAFMKEAKEQGFEPDENLSGWDKIVYKHTVNDFDANGVKRLSTLYDKFIEKNKIEIEDPYETFINDPRNINVINIIKYNMSKEADVGTPSPKNIKDGLNKLKEEFPEYSETIDKLYEVATPKYKFDKKNRTIDVDKLEAEQKLGLEFQKFFPTNINKGSIDAMTGQVTYTGYGVSDLTNVKTGEPLPKIQTTIQKYGDKHLGTGEISQWEGVTNRIDPATSAKIADEVMFGTKPTTVQTLSGEPKRVKIVDPELHSFKARQKVAQDKLTLTSQENKAKFREAVRKSEKLFLEEGKALGKEEFEKRLKWLAAKKQADTSNAKGDRSLTSVLGIAIPNVPYQQQTFMYRAPDGNIWEIVIPQSRSAERASDNISYNTAFGQAFGKGPTGGKNSIENMVDKTKIEHGVTQVAHGVKSIENAITGGEEEYAGSGIYAKRRDLNDLDSDFTPSGKSLKYQRDPSGCLDCAVKIKEIYTTESNYTKIITEEILDKVVDQTGLSEDVIRKRMDDQSKNFMNWANSSETTQQEIDLVATSISSQVYNNKETKKAEEANTNTKEPFDNVIQASAVDGTTGQKNTMKLFDEVRERLKHPPTKETTIINFDVDGTLSRDSNERTVATSPDGKDVLRLSNNEYLDRFDELKAKGYEFDYSEYKNFDGWLPGPRFAELKKLAEDGNLDNVYLVTARLGAEQALHDAFAAVGIDIPMKNIKCCGGDDGKGLVYCQQIADGATWLSMSDDKWKNIDYFEYIVAQCPWVVGRGDRVERPDFGSEVNASGTKSYDEPYIGWALIREQERLLNENFGEDASKKLTDQEARIAGKNKNTLKITPYSARHAINLTSRFYGKGQEGKNSQAFYDKFFYEPYNKAMYELAEYKVNMSNDYKALLKQNKNLKLTDKGPDGNYTREDIVRMSIWADQGEKIPGMDDAKVKELQGYIDNDPALKLFKLNVLKLTKIGELAPPVDSWQADEGGSLGQDINRTLDTKIREQVLTPWKENVNLIFSDQKLNYLESKLGPKWRAAMDEMLNRMESGRSRKESLDPITNRMLNWLNGAAAAALFFNRKSGVLQTLSIMNFFVKDNNILAASKAMIDPSFVKTLKDVATDEYLINRWKGKEIGVAEAEISKRIGNVIDRLGDKWWNSPKKFIAAMIKAGFSITAAFDALAIIVGGGTFVHNRTKTYEKEGDSFEVARRKAKIDMRELSENTQQSYDQKNLSSQQVAGYSRVVLNFMNTAMLYNNRIVEYSENLKSGRGTASDVFGLANYAVLQPVLFAAAQDALLWLLFDDELPEGPKEKAIRDKEIEALYRVLETIVNGTGVTGKVATSIEKMIRAGVKAEGKWNQNLADAALEALTFATTIDMKISKMQSAGYATERAKKNKEGFLGENSLEAQAKMVTTITNIKAPEYILKSIEEMKLILDERTTAIQKVALILGWSESSLEIQGDIGKSQGLPQNYNKAAKKLKANSEFGGGGFGSSPNFGGSNF